MKLYLMLVKGSWFGASDRWDRSQVLQYLLGTPAQKSINLLVGDKVVEVLSNFIKIGRTKQSNHVSLNDDYVSREHCVLYLKEDKWWMKDVGSKHGTFLNTHRLEKDEECELKNGNKIILGKTVLQVILQ